MTSRVSIPLAICVVAAAVAVTMLTRSPDTPAATPPAATAPADTGDNDPSSDSTGSTNEEAAPATIAIEGFAFTEGVTVAPGAAISVPNADGAPHTITSNDGAFDTGTINGGGTGSLTAPTEPGTYGFFCAIHPSMTGTFTVAA